MKPEILASGGISFFICLFIHIFQWRVKRPQNDLKALFVIFMVIPGILSVTALAWIPIPDLFAFLLLHFALSSAYIQSYPPAQAVSPSLEIMILVQHAMPKGLTGAEVAEHFDNDKLVHTRFNDLVNTRLVEEKDGVFTLTPPGSRLITFFVNYRKILGLEFKGG